MNVSGNESIRCCPGCGGTAINWLTPNNFECSDCGFMLFLNAAAAVAVIIECRGKILFGVRKNEPGKGMLDLPGGFVDGGETGEAAARREVREEVGIALQDLRYLYSLPNTYPYRGIVYDTLDLIFLARWDEPQAVQAADDLVDVVWVERDAVDYDRIAFASLRRVVRMYLESEEESL